MCVCVCVCVCIQAYTHRNILNYNFCENLLLALRKVRRLSVREQGAKKGT